MTSGRLRAHEATLFVGDAVRVHFEVADERAVNAYDVIALYRQRGSSFELARWRYSNGAEVVPPGAMPLRRGDVALPTAGLEPGAYEVRSLRAASEELLIPDRVAVTLLDPAPAPWRVFADGNHNAFPSVAQTKTGRLVVAYRSAREHVVSGPARVMQLRSKNLGRTWDAPQVLFEDPDFDCSAGSNLTTLRNGRLLLAVDLRALTVQATPRPSATKILRSDDEGETWTVVGELHPYTVPYGRMLELDDGSVVMPAFGYVSGGGALFRSTDQGSTWTRHGAVVVNDPNVPFGTPGWTSFTETAVLALDGAHWIAVIRGNTFSASYGLNKLYFARSRDGGRTWSPPQFLFEGASPDLVRFEDGTVLLCVSSRDAGLFGVGVRCHTSSDEGRSWSLGKFLVGGQTPDVGYPASIPLGRDEFFTILYVGSGTAEDEASLWALRFQKNAFGP